MAYSVDDGKRTRSENRQAAARRRSPDQARRIRTVRFALTEDEYAELSAAASQAGLARGAYAAEATLAVARDAVTTPDTPLRDAFYVLDRAALLVRRIGVNLNVRHEVARAKWMRRGRSLMVT